jgi:hypothetical protein
MSTVWATVADCTATHPDDSPSEYDVALASRQIAQVLYGAYFDVAQAAAAEALKDATVAQVHANLAASARQAAGPSSDRITSAKIGTASYTLAASTTPESSETRVTGDGVSVDALAILTEAGLLPVTPYLEG